MKRLLIWGTGRVFAMYYKWLLENYDVKAFITNDREFPLFLLEDGPPTISKENIKDFERDIIVIAVRGKARISIRQDAVAIGLSENEIVDLDDFIKMEHLEGKYEADTVARQVRVVKDILKASDKEISNLEWIYNKVIEYGVFCFHSDWYKFSGQIKWNVYGLQQVPEEFADFCVSLSTLKIHTAIEIGVYRGRSSYFICAMLMRENQNMQYTLVDIWDGLDAFDKFYAVLPVLEKRIPSTSEDYKGKKFDFVFIDADHSYDASMQDFENVGKYSNIITCFHDIYAHEYDKENGGTVRAWKEILERTTGKHHRIFSKYPNQWMGIGCVMNLNM